MYVVMRVFNNFQTPAMVFADEDKAIRWAKEQESVFCSYLVKYVEYGWEANDEGKFCNNGESCCKRKTEV